jgi:hypothetical protein
MEQAAEKPSVAVILSPFAVILSAAKDPFHLTQDKRREEPLHLLENANTGILRFAQDDNEAPRMTV